MVPADLQTLMLAASSGRRLRDGAPGRRVPQALAGVQVVLGVDRRRTRSRACRAVGAPMPHLPATGENDEVLS
jgi:hypothetical protein